MATWLRSSFPEFGQFFVVVALEWRGAERGATCCVAGSHNYVGACSQANRFDDDLQWVQGFALSHCVMLRTLYYRAFGTGVITRTASLPGI